MHGGVRRGAGRPLGSPDKKKRPSKPKSSLLPADILLDIAQYHHQRAIELRASIGDRKALSTLDLQAEIRTEHAMAGNAADKAASFYHPKLAALAAMRPPDPTATSLEQMILGMTSLPANQNVDPPAETPLIEGSLAEAVKAAE